MRCGWQCLVMSRHVPSVHKTDSEQLPEDQDRKKNRKMLIVNQS